MARPLLFPTAFFSLAFPLAACGAGGDTSPPTAPPMSTPANPAAPMAAAPVAPTAAVGDATDPTASPVEGAGVLLDAYSASSRSGNARAPSYDDGMQATKRACMVGEDCDQ